MLILSRKLGEKIMIADNIEIVVVEIQKGKVRLGITAPRTCEVHREEVYRAIQSKLKGSSHAEITQENHGQAPAAEGGTPPTMEGAGG